ncbi:MAG TPA: alpha/beta hydrolase [Rhodoferax sp.]|jgi:acetyl esterase/lipase|nr:alpha/beta hydrolase [Rhodoferax sp.]HPW28249.1 alpha/beta hydrolase [Rhodoferax sp.]
MQWIFFGLALALAIWFLGARALRGPDLQAFDGTRHGGAGSRRTRFSNGPHLNDEHRAVIASMGGIASTLKGTPHSQHLGLLRDYMDNMTAGKAFDAQFTPVDAGGVSAEWVLAPGADPTRRTLYIHGGAWMMGSPRSHRVITTRFSEITGGAVLAIDYRLMPEHPRMSGIEDCRSAYRWMLDNGPEGATPANAIFVAGDSAGGNLTLSLIAWVRDQSLRAPNAAVALSPATDGTLGSPSLRANIKTDAMLGPLFGPLSRVPRAVLLWMAWFRHRIRPNDPLVSPVFGDLAGLPPLLIHASDIEMLVDDSVRYANKASAAGSPVTLQTWNHVVHVWHIFNPELTEARQAFDEIGRFIQLHAPRK